MSLLLLLLLSLLLFLLLLIIIILLIWLCAFYACIGINCPSLHSHRKHKDGLEGNLDLVIVAAGPKFSKILVPRLRQSSPNINIEFTENQNNCILYVAGFLKHRYVILSKLNLFLIDYACFKLRNVWLLLWGYNSKSYHYTWASDWRKNFAAVIAEDRKVDDNLKRQIKNRTLYTSRLFLLTRIF